MQDQSIQPQHGTAFPGCPEGSDSSPVRVPESFVFLVIKQGRKWALGGGEPRNELNLSPVLRRQAKNIVRSIPCLRIEWFGKQTTAD